MTKEEIEKLSTEISRTLTDQGLLIEAGWRCLRLAAINPSAPAEEVQKMRMAFFAGAEHLYASIMAMLDPGSEPTENDMCRMEAIHKELEEAMKHYQILMRRNFQ